MSTVSTMTDLSNVEPSKPVKPEKKAPYRCPRCRGTELNVNRDHRTSMDVTLHYRCACGQEEYGFRQDMLVYFEQESSGRLDCVTGDLEWDRETGGKAFVETVSAESRCPSCDAKNDLSGLAAGNERSDFREYRVTCACCGKELVHEYFDDERTADPDDWNDELKEVLLQAKQ